jgi:hypothetical protein
MQPPTPQYGSKVEQTSVDTDTEPQVRRSDVNFFTHLNSLVAYQQKATSPSSWQGVNMPWRIWL